MNTRDTLTNEYYFIKFISEAYTLQNNTTIDGNFITAGGLQYTSSTQGRNNWYWEQDP